MISLVSNCHHIKILHNYWHTPHTVYFIPVIHLFYNWKFIPLHLPHLFLSTSSSTLVIISIFNFAKLMAGNDVSILFNLHFSDCYWNWGSFHLVAGHLYDFLWNVFSRSLPTFLLHFVLLVCKNYLYILSIHPLSFIICCKDLFASFIFQHHLLNFLLTGPEYNLCYLLNSYIYIGLFVDSIYYVLLICLFLPFKVTFLKLL